MATRDRTEIFLRLRGFSRNRRENATEKVILLDEECSSIIQPLWVQQMEDVRGVHKKITSSLKQLEEAQEKRLRKHKFSAQTDNNDEDAVIHNITSAISVLFRKAESGVNDLEAVFKSEVDDDGGTQTELKILRNVKMCLMNEVSKLTRIFSDNQRRFINELVKQKKVMERGADEHSKRVRDELARDAVAYGYREQGMTQEQIDIVMMNQKQVDERVREFEEIAKSVQQIHEMFKDLQGLVIEQGTILDRIDHNMDLAVHSTKEGRKQLEKAAEMQSAGCFKLVVLFLVVLIIGFVVALLAKLAA